MKGFVREIFTSMQGEGIKVGQRQTFIRFLGCNLACRYCDTPETKRMVGPFIHQTKKFRNPIDVDLLLDKIDAPEVAITGGEPLLQPAFLEILCKELKNKSKKIYLDSNGTLPDALAKVIKYIDTVALDFKIPTATCGPKLWQKHRECLRIAATKEVFVKIVINEKVLPQELNKTCTIIKEIDRNIPLVIQPVFGCNISNTLELQKKALSRLKDVRIIPQIHKYLGLR